jgi:hypothetical protein
VAYIFSGFYSSPAATGCTGPGCGDYDVLLPTVAKGIEKSCTQQDAVYIQAFPYY